MSQELSGKQNAGVIVMVALCGFPALELSGFGFGLPLTFEHAMLLATLGGLIGGALLCSNPIHAGIIGGLIAGPLGLYAVYYYTKQRVQVWNLELILVQGIASLPGLAVGKLIQYLWLRNTDQEMELQDASQIFEPEEPR